MNSGCLPDAIAVNHNGRFVLVRLEEIDWIEACDNYACMHCGHEIHMLRATMSDLQARLDCRFVRIHRSTIVNFHRIREFQWLIKSEYRVVLQDGTELAMTKTYRDALESRFLFGLSLVRQAKRSAAGRSF